MSEDRGVIYDDFPADAVLPEPRCKNGQRVELPGSDEWQPEPTELRRPTFEMNAISAAELDASNYDVTYLVDGTLVEGQPCIVAGKQKTLKTSVLVDLSVSLVVAHKFLGVFNVPEARRVGFVSCESGLGTLQETFRRVCIARGCVLSDLTGLVVSDTIPRLDDPACIAALEAFCTENELGVLILDPAYLMLSGADAGNLMTMGERLAGLNRIASRTGVSVILAHHNKKTRMADGNRFDPPQLEEIAWSGFAEFARQWLLLGRRSEYEDGTGKHDLWLRCGGSAGHSGLYGVDVSEGLRSDHGGRHWYVEVRSADEARQDSRERQEEAKEAARDAAHDAKLAADAQRIANAMAKFRDGETKNTIRDVAGLSGSRFNAALAKLLSDEAIVPCDVCKSHRNTPYQGYRLNND